MLLCVSHSVAFSTDPQNDRQSSWVIYAYFQQRHLLHPCYYDHDDAKRQPIPTSSNVDDNEVHDKNGGTIQDDDDDDDVNPKRQLIPTSSQVKSGPIPSLYIQQRPPGGRPRPALLSNEIHSSKCPQLYFSRNNR